MLRSRSRTPPEAAPAPASEPAPTAGVWHLDEDRSRVELRVPYYWGLGTIRARFPCFTATLGLHPEPWFELSADATTVTSASERRDRQLRSPSFFGVDAHPEVRFEAVTTRLQDGHLSAEGVLSAGGGWTEIEIEGRVRDAGGGDYELTAEAFLMHRWLGMTWNPMGMTRPYSKLVIAGRLIGDDEPAPEAPPAPEPGSAPRRARRGLGPRRRCCAPSDTDGRRA